MVIKKTTNQSLTKQCLINNQSGYTLLELLAAMVIIILITTVLVSQIQIRNKDKITIATQQIASDLRQIRNLASARVVNLAGVYPAGGYGIFFNDAASPASYMIVANNVNDITYDVGTDDLIETVTLSDADLHIEAKESANDAFYFIFKNEHEIVTDIPPQQVNPIKTAHTIKIYSPLTDTFWGGVAIYNISGNEYSWGNVEVNYYDS